MKAAILVVSKPSLSVNQAATNRLKNFLYDKNIEFVSETKTTTKKTETIFSLEYSKNMADYVFVLVDKKSYSAFKNAFCKFFLTDVSENSFAKT
ncbi:MAG: hypothetical protein FWD89_02520, partial [Firmicutes bacterium]|nr:hypothetical protein [Bacillota bacterium]